MILFSVNEDTSPVTRHILETIVSKPLPDHFDHIVWTFNLRRLAVLVGEFILWYNFKQFNKSLKMYYTKYYILKCYLNIN